MIASAVHMVIQLTRFPDGVRRVTWVTEITGRDGNTILTNDIFRYVQTGVDEDGKSTDPRPAFPTDPWTEDRPQLPQARRPTDREPQQTQNRRVACTGVTVVDAQVCLTSGKEAVAPCHRSRAP